MRKIFPHICLHGVGDQEGGKHVKAEMTNRAGAMLVASSSLLIHVFFASLYPDYGPPPPLYPDCGPPPVPTAILPSSSFLTNVPSSLEFSGIARGNSIQAKVKLASHLNSTQLSPRPLHFRPARPLSSKNPLFHSRSRWEVRCCSMFGSITSLNARPAPYG